MTIRELLTTAIDASLRAGDEILKVYESDFAVEHKDDKSPLTQADRNAHEVIVETLKPTGLPVLSEEGRDIPHAERSQWSEFWMVDPLDGTKEFVKRNGEFTVNIALIRDGVPVAGVIWVPVKRCLYFAADELGAHRLRQEEGEEGGLKVELDALIERAQRLPVDEGRENYIVVASRSHLSKETEAYIEKLRAEVGDVETRSMGSSLKICLVAEGAADVYPRFAPTMEWDTAAGQAIAQAAGKRVLQYESESPVVYNKADLLNPWFLVC